MVSIKCTYMIDSIEMQQALLIHSLENAWNIHENYFQNAILSQEYTNHSIRATAVTLLEHTNFMRVSEHKSESSIRTYSRKLSESKRSESPMA